MRLKHWWCRTMAHCRQYEATGKLGAYVFCNREGQPIDNKNFSDRVWCPLLRHLGLTKRRPYQMRHTAATLWLASGDAPEWIARQLGHANTQMLFTVYTRTGRDPPGARGLYPGLEPGPLVRSTKRTRPIPTKPHA
jgi:integrase